MKSSYRSLSLALSLTGLGLLSQGCADALKDAVNERVDQATDKVGGVAAEIAQACGLGCPGDEIGGAKIRGIAEGNASISGVAPVDSFFQSVLNYRNACGDVNAGMESDLGAIRADFGMADDADVAAELDAQVATFIDGTISVQEQPARCQIDAMSTIQAAARCDTSVEPGSAMVACKGDCEVDASADVSCDANAVLVCEVSGPAVACNGSCEGGCAAQLTAAVACDGVCRGSCSGSCSAYADAAGTQCAGTCSGQCMGSCETQVIAGAACNGMCRGTCTVQNPQAGCEASAHAECRARAGASIMCRGKCTGDFEPPKVKAECQASAKCEASLNVQCTPPQLVVVYKLKTDASIDTEAQARFTAALENLHRVRLPALLKAAAKADFVARAGEELVTSADGAVKGSVDAALKGDLSVRASFGLGCAVKELPKVQTTLQDSNQRLNNNIMTCHHLRDVLGMNG